MRSVLKWIARAVLVIVVILGGLIAYNFDRLERLWGVNTLFDEDKIVSNFSDMGGLFFSSTLPRGADAVSPLPLSLEAMPASFSFAGQDYALDDWMQANAATGIVVLRDGEVKHEAYFSGGADDLRISWSVAKSFLSILLGTVVEAGEIDSLDDPVTQYVPSLAGSAYEGATIRNVAQMASGVRFNEDYLDFNSDINRMGRVLALGGSMDEFAASLTERARIPGEIWKYVSIDTHVLGMVIRGATGRSVVELMAERVITPLGLEAEPYYLTDGFGVAFVLGGLNLTTRDYARFGQMVLNGGEIDGRRIVSADWIAQSTSVSAPPRSPNSIIDFDPDTGYGLQWWIPPNPSEGEVYGIGVYDQFVYINPGDGVVIALNSANRGFTGEDVQNRQIEMFRTISAHYAAAR
jgi:CubicO group peptidase (beta-lactamase class C family)